MGMTATRTVGAIDDVSDQSGDASEYLTSKLLRGVSGSLYKLSRDIGQPECGSIMLRVKSTWILCTTNLVIKKTASLGTFGSVDSRF